MAVLNQGVLYPANEKVRVARQRYYQQNGIPSDGGASEKFGRADFGPIRIYVPNFPARVAALQRHDLDHIVLDADTSMRGEAIVGGFETGSGCGRFWVAWFLEPQTLIYGLILNPRQTFRSFLLGRRSRSFLRGTFHDDWLEMTVGELRDFSLAKDNFSATALDVFLFVVYTGIGAVGIAISMAMLLLPFAAIFLLVRSLI